MYRPFYDNGWKREADAVSRGLKIASFDPICHGSGGKAREWIPILPGTDLAVVLSMANLLVNEWGIYDREYLKQKTNGPYLIKDDKRYGRDESGEPVMRDLADGKTKNWKKEVKDPALEVEFEVMGIKCRPAFDIVKEHLQKYTPEWAENISTVKASTIRRIATEFGDAANIGGTIEIDGVKLPYRPVSAIQFRGGSGHSNGFHVYLGVGLLNQLMGCCEVPGGVIGWAARSDGNPWTGSVKFAPKATKDGHLTSSNWPQFMEENPTPWRRIGRFVILTVRR